MGTIQQPGKTGCTSKVIVAVIGAAAVIIAAIIGANASIRAAEIPLHATQTAEARLTPVAQVEAQAKGQPTATAASSPTPVPSPTPSASPAASFPQLPAGYTPYGAFTAEKSWQSDWWIDDSQKMCALTNQENLLNFSCSNTTSQDTVATLHASLPFSSPKGVAVITRMQRDQGDLELVFRGECPGATQKRDFHLSLHQDYSKASLLKPLEGYSEQNLGRVDVSKGEFHVLQIEVASGLPVFSVDHQVVPITPADVPACLEMKEWFIDLYTWKDGNQIAGQIYLVGTR